MNKEYQLGSQLDLEKINKKNFKSEFFGNWIKESHSELTNKFTNAEPFPHIVINNFFSDDTIKKIIEEFPDQNQPMWFLYYNPIEHKRAINDISKIPPYIKECIEMINHNEFINIMSKISGIDGLGADEFLHGGGLHSYPSNGKLNIHLDYSIHPLSGKERRLNLIIFVNNEWDNSWGGNLQLLDDPDNPQKKVVIEPKFNSAVLFQTCDLSYHGLPDLIKCPKNLSRNSLAVYYVTEPRENVVVRPKAKFYAEPCDKNNIRLKKLLEIRAQRRLTAQDLEEIYPDWEKDLYGV